MKHCGVHWPNGPEKFGMLSSLPASLWLMTSPEARYHYDRMRRLGKVVVWRDVPAPGNRPAELQYHAKKAADAAMVLWKEQPHYGIEHFQSHCELTLNYERGDNEDDFQNLDNRHRVLATFLADLEPALRARLPAGTLLHFPPWVPDGRSYDRLDIWRPVADRYDVISHHEYGPPEGILERVQWHLDTWPTKGVILSEWHNDEPERTLQLLAELADREPRFLGATWFIAHWYGAPPDWPAWKNLQDDDDLYRLFLNPPVITRVPDPIPEPTPEPETPTMPDLPRGIDVASYQGYPDWAAVAASGVRFAITKATESVDYVNPTLAHNWAGIRANGIVRGAYHYARLERGNAAHDEAEYFVAAVERVGGLQTGDLLALDLEPTVTVPGAGDWALAWLRRVEQLVGFKPLVYTGPWVVAQQGLAAHPELGQYGLWLAAYQPAMPPAPAPWQLTSFWQFSSNGRVPGIIGDVDLNVFNGDAERIPLYGKPGAVEPPSYSVGEGILNAMTANGDVPATDEQFVSPQWSEAVGQSGAVYRWVGSIGRVIRIDPAA